MLLKILVLPLLTMICVTAVPISFNGRSDARPHAREPVQGDQAPSAVLKPHPINIPGDVHDQATDSGAGTDTDANDKKRPKSADGRDTAPGRKKRATGNGKKPAGTASDSDQSDTPVDAEPKAPEVPKGGGGNTSSSDSSETGNAEQDDDKPSADGEEPVDGAPAVEPRGGTKPNGEPKAATGPPKTDEKPPPSSGAPSGATDPTVSAPKDKNNSGGAEKPDFAADGEPPLDSELSPAAMVGGVIAGVALLVAALVAWSRRGVAQSQVYEAVQGEDVDADGWNEGWDDGWEEGTAAKA